MALSDDVDDVTESLGVAHTAANDLTDVLSGLGLSGASAAQSVTSGFAGVGPVARGLEGIFGSLSGGLDSLAQKGVLSADQVAQAKEGISQATEMLGPYAAAVDLAVAATKELVGTLVDLGKMAIGATQAKDALRSMIGADTLEMVEEMSTQIPYTTDQLGAWASKLKIVGYEGEQLRGALEAVAAGAARMKDGGAAATALLERLKMMADVGKKVDLGERRMLTYLKSAGLGIGDLAATLGVPIDKLKTMSLTAEQVGDAVQRALIQKGAGPLKQLGQTWDVITSKMREGIEDAFEDLGDIVHPFMSEVQSLFSEFFKGSAASKGLAGIVRGILTPAFRFATEGVRALHFAFLYIEIYALKAYIALRPIGQALERLAAAAHLSWAAGIALKGFLATLALILGVVAVAAALAALPFVIVAAVVLAVAAGIAYLIDVISEAIDHFDQIEQVVSEWAESAAQAGADFVQGLVDGIIGGVGSVVDAVQGLASSALSAFTSTFGIKSPSTVMRKHGKENIAEDALAAGIDEGGDEVDRAMRDLAKPPPQAKGKGGRASSGGRSQNVYVGTVNYSGPVQDFPIFREQFQRMLEELNASAMEPEATS